MNMVLRRQILSPARRKRQHICSLVRKWFYEALGNHKHLRVSQAAPEYPNCKEVAILASIELRFAKNLDKPACLRRLERLVKRDVKRQLSLKAAGAKARTKVQVLPADSYGDIDERGEMNFGPKLGWMAYCAVW
jgi:hypothetical protein